MPCMALLAQGALPHFAAALRPPARLTPFSLHEGLDGSPDGGPCPHAHTTRGYLLASRSFDVRLVSLVHEPPSTTRPLTRPLTSAL